MAKQGTSPDNLTTLPFNIDEVPLPPPSFESINVDSDPEHDSEAKDQKDTIWAAIFQKKNWVESTMHSSLIVLSRMVPDS